QHSSDLFRLPNAFTPKMVAEVERSLAKIIEEVRFQAVPLVDAFGISDFRLNSALGRSDGKVYDNYLKWAMEDPLNTESGEVVRKQWFDQYYKPVLHSRL
ncbi:Peroxisomal acyl-coenzyme A oxidase 1, partial [Coemansia sp. RSA 2531]